MRASRSGAAGKRRIDACPVFVCHPSVAHYACPIHADRTEQRQMRREQKKGYVAGLKKSAHLCKYRKGRIIDHHAAVRIIVVFVIAARPEGPHDFPPLDIGIFPKPSQDCIINGLRSITIVRRFAGLEFRHKTVIILVYLPPRFTGHNCVPPWFIGEKRTLYIHVVNHRNVLCFWRVRQPILSRPKE